MVPWAGAGRRVIWCCGDSITAGSGVTCAYPYALAAGLDDRLKPAGRFASAVSFVGHAGSGRYVHSGTPGITAGNLAVGMPGYALTDTPTDVVIYAGINDLGAGDSAATTLAHITLCRDAALSRFPAARIWVVALAPNGLIDVTATNTLIAGLTGLNGGAVVNSHIAGWAIADDMQGATNVHPNQTGADIIGAAINSTMQAAGA